MQMIYFIINVVLSNQNGKILRKTVVWSNGKCSQFTKDPPDVTEKRRALEMLEKKSTSGINLKSRAYHGHGLCLWINEKHFFRA